MTTTTDKLKEVANLTNGNERRAEMRKVFSTVLGKHLKTCNWGYIGSMSPLIGTDKGQYNLRPSWSEYRDRCSVQVMAYMIVIMNDYENTGDKEKIHDFLDEFVNSILKPEEDGVIVSSVHPIDSIQRYDFGRHVNWIGIEHVWNSLIDTTTQTPKQTKAPTTKPITKDKNMDAWTISSEQKDRELLDSVLKQVTGNEVCVERIESAINGGLEAQRRNAELEQELKRRPKTASAPIVMPAGLPDLKDVKWVNANKVFRSGQKTVKALNFEVPVFEWGGVHPDVPSEDESYVFRTDLLVPVLLALVDNKKAWISGHTGTGKSTLVKQIAALLNWPVITLSLDGEITRMDLIGRDSLTSDDKGNTVSKFVDGVLPKAFSQPCILLCDEIDFVRDDIAYTLQTALNENEVTVTEDGGRVVRATQWSRIIATANTLGQGDDSGLYRGAKVQSQAFLDRFTTWIDVPYMTEEQERKLIVGSFGTLNKAVVNTMLSYAREHREGFVKATVLQPLSPRGMLALADKYQRYQPLFSDDKAAMKQAIAETLLNRANPEDKIVLEGIVNRVFSV